MIRQSSCNFTYLSEITAQFFFRILSAGGALLRTQRSRMRLFLLLLLFGCSVLVFRLFYLQITQGAFYAEKAQQLRVRTVSSQGVRGTITDRYGTVLACSKIRYQICFTPSDIAKDDINASICAALPLLQDARTHLLVSLPIQSQTPFVFASEGVDAFLSQWNLPVDLSAEQVVQTLLEKFGVSSLPREYQLSFLALRLAIEEQGYRAYSPLAVAYTDDDSICAQFAEQSDRFPGFSITPTYLRSYPYGTTLCHVLGYTGKISADEQDEYAGKGYDIQQDRIGRSGLEAMMEEVLRPKRGGTQVSIDSLGYTSAILQSQQPQDGQNVVTTIDLRLQQAAEKALETTMADIRSGRLGEAFPRAQIGAVVALDIRNGQVLAMASAPTFDPNLFSQTMDDTTWRQLSPTYTKADGTTDPDPTLPRPLVNNAIASAFAPGSIFKPVTALAALGTSAITPAETIEDSGRYTRFSETQAPACWTWNESHTTHGFVNLQSALAGSCNYYFYELGYRIGSARLAQMCQDLGLGAKSGIGLPGESAGTIDSAEHANASIASKLAADLHQRYPSIESSVFKLALLQILQSPSLEKAKASLCALGVAEADVVNLYPTLNDNRWRESRILAAAIGQGDQAFTPLQMANMTAALAGRGKRFVPQLVLSLPDSTGIQDAQIAQDAFLSEADTQAVKAGMVAVTQTGTAAKYFRDFPYTVAAKTGTAQSTGRDAFAWFIAYAPAENPKIAVSVMIGQGGHGGYAAPVARAVLEAYFAPGESSQAVAPAESLLP